MTDAQARPSPGPVRHTETEHQMYVKMRKQIGGYRNGEPWPPVGASIELPDHEAADMIANGYAQEANDADTDDASDTDDATPDAGPDAAATDSDDGGQASTDNQDEVTPKGRGRRAK